MELMKAKDMIAILRQAEAELDFECSPTVKDLRDVISYLEEV